VRNIPGFRDPLVRVRMGGEDLAELAEGLRRLCELLFAAGAVRIYTCTPGLPVLHSPADVAKLPETLDPGHANPTTMHLFSSCPMGENADRCAADSHGRVHGVDRLSIADASLLCSPTVVNPQASVMAVAHRNALHVIERGFR
jgi:choline dehydrogenase-like flavoprotein